MGEKRNVLRRTNGSWSGKLLSVGSTGFLAAVSLLLVLGTASAGAVHAAVVLKAPYKGTASWSSAYSSWSGCATAKVSAAKWAAKTGTVHASSLGKGYTGTGCKSIGTYGGGGSGYSSTGVTVLIPLGKVTTGNHSVASSWSLTVATVKMFTYGGCPAKNVNYYPPLYGYSSGQCFDSASVSLYADEYLYDASNSSWYSYNSSYASAYNDSYYDNSTYCYNYGTPSCSNSTYAYNYSSAYSYNAPGFATFAWNGLTTYSSWTNGSYMKSTDKYYLAIYFGVSGSGGAQSTNLLAPWNVLASGSVNMATLGNGAVLNSVTIV